MLDDNKYKENTENKNNTSDKNLVDDISDTLGQLATKAGEFVNKAKHNFMDAMDKNINENKAKVDNSDLTHKAAYQAGKVAGKTEDLYNAAKDKVSKIADDVKDKLS